MGWCSSTVETGKRVVKRVFEILIVFLPWQLSPSLLHLQNHRNLRPPVCHLKLDQDLEHNIKNKHFKLVVALFNLMIKFSSEHSQIIIYGQINLISSLIVLILRQLNVRYSVTHYLIRVAWHLTVGIDWSVLAISWFEQCHRSTT